MTTMSPCELGSTGTASDDVMPTSPCAFWPGVVVWLVPVPPARLPLVSCANTGVETTTAPTSKVDASKRARAEVMCISPFCGRPPSDHVVAGSIPVLLRGLSNYAAAPQ